MSQAKLKKIYALFNLAFHFILHWLKKPFVSHHEGLPTFLDHYKNDQLIPLKVPDKKLLLKFSECINCHLCDMACPSLMRLPRERFLGPSYLLTAYTRSFSDLRYTQLDLTICQECMACQNVCPNQIPVHEAVSFIQTKIAEQMQWAAR